MRHQYQTTPYHLSLIASLPHELTFLFVDDVSPPRSYANFDVSSDVLLLSSYNVYTLPVLPTPTTYLLHLCLLSM